jgi:hypothetical protein
MITQKTLKQKLQILLEHHLLKNYSIEELERLNEQIRDIIAIVLSEEIRK